MRLSQHQWSAEWWRKCLKKCLQIDSEREKWERGPRPNRKGHSRRNPTLSKGEAVDRGGGSNFASSKTTARPNINDGPGNSRESVGALGYEPTENWNYNTLQDAGGPRKTLRIRESTTSSKGRSAVPPAESICVPVTMT